jgi:hypothetical protein
MSLRSRTRRTVGAGAAPLSPRRKWRAITLATLLLVPAFWSVLAGLVAVAAMDGRDVPNAGAFIAFGVALVPFVFLTLAFLSEHRRAPVAVIKAMGLSLLIGIPVSALTADAVTGIVAGVGAGGVVALRMDLGHTWKARAMALLAVCAYLFLMLRTAGDVALILAPVFPFTSIGLADHFSERRREREARGGSQPVSSR